MGTPEQLQPGDNIKVKGCDKKPTFCEVTSGITERQKREDNHIPLRNPRCGCVRCPEKARKIPHILP